MENVNRARVEIFEHGFDVLRVTAARCSKKHRCSGSRINDAFFSFKISVKISGFEDDALLPAALSPPDVPACPSLDASGSASTELKLLSLLLPPVAPAPGDSSKPSAGLLLKLPSVPMVSCTD
uniref:(northern house mosquito) hypothetical protein n=1 Tax=Culex pipiens TaxID=7175 RepID=A0A8D8D850_CULPI